MTVKDWIGWLGTMEADDDLNFICLGADGTLDCESARFFVDGLGVNIVVGGASGVIEESTGGMVVPGAIALEDEE